MWAVVGIRSVVGIIYKDDDGSRGGEGGEGGRRDV